MEKREREEERIEEPNWSERVEDLVAAGDMEEAISFLEALVSKLEVRFGSSSNNGRETSVIGLQLASALAELANLYASRGFSLKSDELRSRSSLVKQRVRALEPSSSGELGVLKKEAQEDQAVLGNVSSGGLKSELNSSLTDDWEAIADHDPSELLSSVGLPDISSLSVEEPKVQGPKRRGRGTFSYKRNELYSDKDYDETVVHDSEDHDQSCDSEKNAESLKSKYGTRHVLVLADFSPSMRTTDLERLFKDFKDRGVAIRWVNDTTALAVFRTPSTALEACNTVQCTFTVRVLNDDDTLLGSISTRDLEPPCQRPKTSARTAQRLIAQGMGLKLPSSTFGSKELRNQEETRKNRIVTRQKLRDDAWGDD